MKRYAIWDKVSPIITPIGEVLSAAQWMERYPVAALDDITVVCSAGEVNGGFFGTLWQMKHICENDGCDFSKCITNEDILEAIEAFEDAKDIPVGVSNEEITASALASIAASLEYQNMMTLEDAEVK